MTFSENNSRCRRYLQSKNMKIKKTEGLRTFEKCFLEKKDKQFLLLEKGHAVTLQILSAWSFSMVESGKKTFSSLIFWKYGVDNEFYGTIDIFFQMKGTDFSVIHGPEKPKLLHTGTCTSTWAQGNVWTGPFFLDHFLDYFLDHFRGGEHTIITEGGVGGSLSVLREGWEAECYYSGRGVRRTITTQGRVGGGCNGKHYQLMELYLDRTNNFNWFFD